MNSKLLIFVFILIALKSISSSIIKYKFNDGESLIEIDGLNYQNIAYNQENGLDNEKNPFKNIRELTFNRSETVIIDNEKTPELICNDSFRYKLCSTGNGKYQAEFVRCINMNYGTEHQGEFVCEHSGHRVTNKNLRLAIFAISCYGDDDLDQENAKGKCIFQYSYKKLLGFSEDDDVKHE